MLEHDESSCDINKCYSDTLLFKIHILMWFKNYE